MAEFRREKRQERQEPSVPQARPFDLDADDARRQQIEDNLETILAKPVIQLRVDVSEEKKNQNGLRTLPKPWPRCKYR